MIGFADDSIARDTIICATHECGNRTHVGARYDPGDRIRTARPRRAAVVGNFLNCGGID